MKTLVKAGLLALLVGSTFGLPVQKAGAAIVRYRTVCTTTHGVKTCHKVAY